MYKSLRIRNFRGFRDLTLDNLARINLITGKNNSGKTTLLEALLLLQGVSPKEVIANLRRVERQQVRVEHPDTEGIGPQSSAEEMREEIPLLFRQMDLDKAIEITGQTSESVKRSLRIAALKEWPEKEIEKMLARLSRLVVVPEDFWVWPADRVFVFDYQEGEQNYKSLVIISKEHSVVLEGIPSLADVFCWGGRILFLTPKIIGDYGNLEKAGEAEIVSQFLRLIEPRIERLVTIYDDRRNEPVLYGELRDTQYRVPLHTMGDGVVRLADLAVRLGNTRNGLLLIDEFENGLHWSILPTVWETLGELSCLLNVQVFATTHSYECVQTAYEVFSRKNFYDFRLYRLEEVEGNIQAIAYDHETLGIALEARLEVR